MLKLNRTNSKNRLAPLPYCHVKEVLWYVLQSGDLAYVTLQKAPSLLDSRC